ncbi:MAG: hypothetical protein ACLVB5_00730 [Christensenellales bacterium]
MATPHWFSSGLRADAAEIIATLKNDAPERDMQCALSQETLRREAV